MTQQTNEMTRANGNGNGQALARAPKNDLRSYLDSPAVRRRLMDAAGKVMKAEDLTRFALIAASRQPELANCTRESVLRALLDAAALGIKPGGLMGRGYLVPRKKECCFDPGWRGLIDIARRSGQIKRIESHVVHAKDDFSYERTPLTTLRHVPTEADDPGPVRAAYAVAEFADGSLQIEVVLKRDLDKIRKLGAGGGPWATWFDEMARKSAVRRLCKYLPFDPVLDQALHHSDTSDGGDIDAAVVEEPKQRGRKTLADRLSERDDGANMLPPTTETTEGASEPPHDPETGEVTDQREPGDDAEAEQPS